ncbi:hypothetical protein JCM10212_001523 [Sporobolomyces blumeae]
MLLPYSTPALLGARIPAVLLASHLVCAYSSNSPMAHARNAKSRVFSTAPPASPSGIDLYSVRTPNGLKVNIALEELNALGTPIEYKEHAIDFSKKEQKEPWFLEINPNGRIPAIVDRSNDDIKVWETGSILRYLAEHYDKEHKLHFDSFAEETEMYNWIFFQHGGLGPMAGQANHFLSADIKLPYAAKRYMDETKRLMSVYESRMSEAIEVDGQPQEREYLAGKGKGKFSYADIASFTWVRIHPFSLGVPSLSTDFPRVARWLERIEAREGVKRAVKGDMLDKFKSKEGWEAESRQRVEWVERGEEKPKRDEL